MVVVHQKSIVGCTRNISFKRILLLLPHKALLEIL